MFCHLCATKIEKGDFFCRNCGEISPVLVSTLDKRNWLATAGIFALCAISYSVLLFAIFQILIMFDPGLRSPFPFIWLLLVSGSVASGVCVVLARDRSEMKRKLESEREKRRTILTEAAAPQLVGNTPQDPAFGITEHTTVKFERK